jgi:hypothetical protein
MIGPKPAGEVAMLPRMVQVIMSVVAASVVANPGVMAVAAVNVRRVGMTLMVDVVAMVLGRMWRAVEGGRSVSRRRRGMPASGPLCNRGQGSDKSYSQNSKIGFHIFLPWVSTQPTFGTLIDPGWLNPLAS